MLLSNPKIDYTSVRRIANAKLSEQASETPTSTTNTMSTSTSLQDISSHHAPKFTWNNNANNSNTNNNNNNNDNKDTRIVNFYEQLLSSNSGGKLNSSRSDELIFEHPEVTIKPSVLDSEIQKRLLTIKQSTTSENLAERDAGKIIPNVLEHPDMRSPVVMQTIQISSSSSSSALLNNNNNNCKTINRAQSVDLCVNSVRALSPTICIEGVNDNAKTTNRSSSSNSLSDEKFHSLEQEQNQDLYSSSSSIPTDSAPQ